MTHDKEKIQAKLCRRCVWATLRLGGQVACPFPLCVWERIAPQRCRDRITGEVRQFG